MKQRKSSFGALSFAANFAILIVVLVIIAITGGIIYYYTKGPTPTPTIAKAAKKILTTAKALITPAPTKKDSTPAPTTKFPPKYPKVINTIGSNAQFNCAGAQKVLNGGIWCVFPTKEDAEKYCESNADCAGYSISKTDPNNKAAQVTSKTALNTTPNTAWDWYPKNPTVFDKILLGISNIPPITTKP